MSRRTRATRALLLGLSALLLCACATMPQPDLAAWWPFSRQPQTPTAPPVVINVLGWTGTDAENRHLQQSIAALEQTHPTWRVSGQLVPDYATALADRLNSAAPPDLFLAYSHHLADLVAAGHLQPLPATLNTDALIAPNLAAGLRVNGRAYCIPRDVAVLALYYNRAVFDRAGASYPTTAWTWDDLRAAAEATTDRANGYYGLTLAYDASSILPFLQQSDTDGSPYTGDDAAAALEFYMQLYNSRIAVEPITLDATWNGEALGRGRAAMTLEGNWLVRYLAATFPDLDYGIIELPSGGARPAATAFVSCWVIHRAATDPAAALELAQFLTAPSQTLAWANASGNLPPTLDQATVWLAANPIYAPFVNALPHAVPWTGTIRFNAQVEAVNTGMRMWMEDTMTSPQLLERLATLAPAP